MDLVNALKQFGFTRQEARMYIALIERGEATGYEVAKRTGISRSNAYAALSNLVDKGVVLISCTEIKKYAPVPKKELMAQLRCKTEETLAYLEAHLPKAVKMTVPYFTISGNDNVMARIDGIIDMAQSHIYISAHSDELVKIAGKTKQCVRRSIKTVIISNADPDIDGVIFYEKSKDNGHIKIIADTKRVLMGNIGMKDKNCLYSEDTHLVHLMREAILNEIELFNISKQRNIT